MSREADGRLCWCGFQRLLPTQIWPKTIHSSSYKTPQKKHNKHSEHRWSLGGRDGGLGARRQWNDEPQISFSDQQQQKSPYKGTKAHQSVHSYSNSCHVSNSRQQRTEIASMKWMKNSEARSYKKRTRPGKSNRNPLKVAQTASVPSAFKDRKKDLWGTPSWSEWHSVWSRWFWWIWQVR